ncbi:hypothetical protein SLA_6876 [Streptomyces laurentii]|uniref:Uncharacterized protein n=1 Tax=Streptomyces laurentii TaxID=39478 RepID=A0A169PGL1_STRLU|nr:hypothetical protein SLA_6876 [Streptomyces laurentii]
MATTEDNGTTIAPKDCVLGALMMDVGRGVAGIVMGRDDGVRVQLRPLNGGREWDADRVRHLTSHEELRVRCAARNEMMRRRGL